MTRSVGTKPFALLVTVLTLATAVTSGPARAEDDPWPGIRQEVFGSREIVENDGIVTLFTPERAEDAAIVPLSIRFPADQIKAMTNEVRGAGWREAQVMIRHPNFTGLQMDPISRGYVPARFVNELEVRSAGAVVFRMEGGISISENPNVRFTYAAAPSELIEVNAKDTLGTVIAGRSTPSGS